MHCMLPQVERLRVRCLKLKSCSDDYSLKSDSSVTFVNGQLPIGILEHVQLHKNYIICCNYQNGTSLSTMDPNSVHWNVTMRKDVDLITNATNATFIYLSNTRKHQGCTWPTRHYCAVIPSSFFFLCCESSCRSWNFVAFSSRFNVFFCVYAKWTVLQHRNKE